MEPYLILKFIHVLLAITAVGSNITYGIWLGRASREPQHLQHVLRGVKFLDDRVANPGYGLLFATGLAMLYVGKIPWTTPWLLTALILYIALVAFAFRGYTPLLRRQIAALETGGLTSDAYKRVAMRAQQVGILLAVLVVIIVFLMVTKPALWG